MELSRTSDDVRGSSAAADPGTEMRRIPGWRPLALHGSRLALNRWTHRLRRAPTHRRRGYANFASVGWFGRRPRSRHRASVRDVRRRQHDWVIPDGWRAQALDNARGLLAGGELLFVNARNAKRIQFGIVGDRGSG